MVKEIKYKQTIFPVAEESDKQLIREIVNKLNSVFTVNAITRRKMRPFWGAFCNNGVWYVVCSDHYTWSDDKRFPVFVLTLTRKYKQIEFQWVFDTNINVICHRQFKIV